MANNCSCLHNTRSSMIGSASSWLQIALSDTVDSSAFALSMFPEVTICVTLLAVEDIWSVTVCNHEEVVTRKLLGLSDMCTRAIRHAYLVESCHRCRHINHRILSSSWQWHILYWILCVKAPLMFDNPYHGWISRKDRTRAIVCVSCVHRILRIKR